MVAAEDAKFVDHEGFDQTHPAGHGKEPAVRPRRRGRLTITQQLAKNLLLSPSRSYWRKGEEAVITVMLEQCS
jgi:monofunctional biosynthetic peptidoglycan transglycosylase